jgi:DNA-binding response OmpR family regulator
MSAKNAEKAPAILAVDDDLHVRRTLDRTLREEGYTTRTAHDIQSGLEALRTGEFAMAILDVRMGEETGFDLAHRIRAGEAGERNKTLPIVFLTAETDETSYETSFDVGAIAYVTKPFQSEQVIAAVETVLHG